MHKFIIKRILAIIPVLIGVTFLVFVILSFAPGDPARILLGLEATDEQVAVLRDEMGLNDPLIIQYVHYIFNLIRGDMGNSYKTGLPVITEIMDKFPNTMQIVIPGLILAIFIAIPLGIVAAVKQNSIVDGASMVVAMFGISIPLFWWGILLMMLFTVKLGWLPSGGMNGIKSMIMPVIAISFQSLAGIARTTRSSMLEVIRSDYIRTARSKGVQEKDVIFTHALKNALIPTLTVTGLQICTMISGTTLIENLFSWPGIGRLLVTALNDRDRPVILGCIVVFTVCYTIVNLIVDILYGVVDPRIKAMYKR